MSHSYDPRRLLRQISNPLLQALFAQRDVLQDFPWDEISESRIEPVFAAWQRLPDAKRKEIQVILQDVHALADGRGLRIFAEEIHRRFPNRAGDFAAIEGRLDKALWAYLNLRDAFDQAALFARADALMGGRYWVKRNTLPRGPVAISADKLADLQQALRDHYWPAEMRGKHCKVEHYERKGGAQFFYAYLDDWPDRQLVFADDGEMIPQNERFAFSNVFVFNTDEGSLELVAKGGAAVHLPLQQAFCRAVLGIEVGRADPLRPAYRLGMLLEPGFELVTDPGDGIARVSVRLVRIGPATVAGQAVNDLRLTFPPQAELHNIVRSIRHCVDQLGGDTTVRAATFELEFLPDAAHCVKKMSFTVTAPSTCDLKSKSDEMRLVGERCLRIWGVIDE